MIMWDIKILSIISRKGYSKLYFIWWIYGVLKEARISGIFPQKNPHLITKILSTFYSGYVAQSFKIVGVHCKSLYENHICRPWVVPSTFRKCWLLKIALLQFKHNSKASIMRSADYHFYLIIYSSLI